MTSHDIWSGLSWRMKAHLEALVGGGYGVFCLPSSAEFYFVHRGLAERTDENGRGVRATELARSVVAAGTGRSRGLP